MNAAMAIDAPKVVVPAALELVSETPMQTAARARMVSPATVFPRKKYWSTATQGVVIILANLEGCLLV